MNDCSFCESSFNSSSKLRQHVKQIHPHKKPYSCMYCSQNFKIYGSKSRHEKSCRENKNKNKKQKITNEKFFDKEIKNKRFKHNGFIKDIVINNDKKRLMLVYSTTEFEMWCKNKDNKDVSLSDETTKNIICLYKNIIKQYDIDTVISDMVLFSDFIDQYIDDKQSKISHTTICNHLRYIKWVLQWKLSINIGKIENLDNISETIIEYQKCTTRNTHSTYLLNFMTPSNLIDIRQKIIERLRKIQINTIDITIKKFLLFDTSVDNMKEFSIRLRNWLEWCLRIIDIPMRIQCSTYLLMPDNNTPDFVSKLEKCFDGYYRIINRDKVHKSHNPIRIRIPSCLQPYLHFFIRYCRSHLTDNLDYVFPSNTGILWKSASKDIKTFMNEEMSLDPYEIESSGRLVHCTRKIALASFAVKVGYDIDKIRSFCKLIRHSLSTSEQYYSHWMDTKLSQNASDEWKLQMLNEPDEPDTYDVYIPKTIRYPCDNIIKWFFKDYKTPNNEYMKFTKVDASTQTCGNEYVLNISTETETETETETKTKITNISSSLSICTHCNTRYSVFGPYGLKKNKEMFGKYFTQCIQCNGKRPCKNTIWYDLGVQPPVKSVSSKPRNIVDILSYIKENI